MAPQTPPRITRLGAYTIDREIGRGGMATVYEAVHTDLGRRVAIKVMSESLADQPVAMERFGREARVLAKLDHPHIVPVTDLGTWEGRAYFVMALLEGPTLAAHLRERGRLAPAEIAEIFLPLASAIAAAHASDVVHRDLKPSNVLLARRRGGTRTNPMVLDFGISKSADDDEQTLTRSGALIGTVQYLSPEATRGARHATAASDQYALGVMMYECATGAPPFRGESSYETMHAIATKDATAPRELVPGLPEGFAELVMRAMHRDPARRFPSVAALGRALLAFADERTAHVWRDELEAGAAGEAPRSQRRAPAPSAPRAEATLTEEPVLTDRRAGEPSARARTGPETTRPARSRRWVGVGGGAIAIAALAILGWSARRGGDAIVPTPPQETASASAGASARESQGGGAELGHASPAPPPAPIVQTPPAPTALSEPTPPPATRPAAPSPTSRPPRRAPSASAPSAAPSTAPSATPAAAAPSAAPSATAKSRERGTNDAPILE